jgi:hypothetical protein
MNIVQIRDRFPSGFLRARRGERGVWGKVVLWTEGESVGAWGTTGLVPLVLTLGIMALGVTE